LDTRRNERTVCKMFITFVSALLFLTFSEIVESQGVGCGRQAPNLQPSLQPRIINGLDAKQNSWPWIISLQEGGSHFCGGSLLRVKDNKEESDIVLTAGHCFGGSTENLAWDAVANLHWQSYQFNAEKRKVVRGKRHESYKNFTMFDIGLIKLDKPIKFSETIRPVCLPKQGEAPPIGKQCVAAGWGRISKYDQDYKSADILQQLIMPVLETSKCEIWGSSYNKDVSICAAAVDYTGSTCSGDSGGPLVCKSDDGRWVQYGAVSYGTGGYCVWKDSPTVFTRISNFADWIQTNIRQMTSL